MRAFGRACPGGPRCRARSNRFSHGTLDPGTSAGRRWEIWRGALSIAAPRHISRNAAGAVLSGEDHHMRYNPLGRTGLFVSELCLGTMTYGSGGRFQAIAGLGQREADALLKGAIDAGVNFIDAANVYSEGQSETNTRQAIRNLS